MGVIASFAVFSVISSAPPIIVVSSCVKSPPLPAYFTQKKKKVLYGTRDRKKGEGDDAPKLDSK